MQVRTKVVEMDGAKWTISSLSLKQTEDFLAEQKKIIEMPDSDPRTDALKTLWRGFICTSLNNAMQNGDARYEPKDIHEQFDLLSFTKVRDEILRFTGLAEEPTKPGEAQAAS